ncbi:PREDICTED: uncharacterized protein LOC108754849 [Trachymyrmex septentrionalis]|uniref:uncharacterized protein LOC108754849 n=1 Tax=Trachymyrmex septentrionalis TaxID=34720 RepID=UPI00084ED668|nr:PREDICTED: uncharacterized protein LOC108754849 [Trachymyrmex septentrionalis]
MAKTTKATGEERWKIQIVAQSSRAIRFLVILAPSSTSARSRKPIMWLTYVQKRQDACPRWNTSSFLDSSAFRLAFPRSTLAADKLRAARVWKLHTPLQRTSRVCSNRLGRMRDAWYVKENGKNRIAGKGESTLQYGCPDSESSQDGSR